MVVIFAEEGNKFKVYIVNLGNCWETLGISSSYWIKMQRDQAWREKKKKVGVSPGVKDENTKWM